MKKKNKCIIVGLVGIVVYGMPVHSSHHNVFFNYRLPIVKHSNDIIFCFLILTLSLTFTVITSPAVSIRITLDDFIEF